MPSVSGQVIRDIVEICNLAKIETLTLPGLHDILVGNGSLGKRIREVQIEDLLRRDPIQTDTQLVNRLLKGKRILITGAGGSIGSELCRQILHCSPSQMVLLGHGENSVFQIQQELKEMMSSLGPELQYQCKKISLIPFIADLRHPSRLAFGI